jgi:biopolymer transport protein ExbD
MKISVKKKAITTTALISMTDVVFLLLIFLLITSNFITYTGIPINIPVAEHAHSELQRNISLAITTIDDREVIFINDERVRPDELVNKLRVEVERNPEAIIMIQADQNISIGRVVFLVDSAKSAGSNRFFIAAQLAGRGA